MESPLALTKGSPLTKGLHFLRFIERWGEVSPSSAFIYYSPAFLQFTQWRSAGSRPQRHPAVRYALRISLSFLTFWHFLCPSHSLHHNSHDWLTFSLPRIRLHSSFISRTHPLTLSLTLSLSISVSLYLSLSLCLSVSVSLSISLFPHVVAIVSALFLPRLLLQCPYFVCEVTVSPQRAAYSEWRRRTAERPCASS